MRRGGAAYTITEECERLFCETLRAVFLGEGSQQRQDSLVTGMHNNNDYGVEIHHGIDNPDRFVDSPPSTSDAVQASQRGDVANISDYIEMWDYVGGHRFRGFVTEKQDEKALFVFFDQSVVKGDLKAGIMALLELREVDYFSHDRLVVCVDRTVEQQDRDRLTKNLGWVGFSLTTLNEYAQGEALISDKWLFMDIET